MLASGWVSLNAMKQKNGEVNEELEKVEYLGHTISFKNRGDKKKFVGDILMKQPRSLQKNFLSSTKKTANRDLFFMLATI